jgi:hypothetical protein
VLLLTWPLETQSGRGRTLSELVQIQIKREGGEYVIKVMAFNIALGVYANARSSMSILSKRNRHTRRGLTCSLASGVTPHLSDEDM